MLFGYWTCYVPHQGRLDQKSTRQQGSPWLQERLAIIPGGGEVPQVGKALHVLGGGEINCVLDPGNNFSCIVITCVAGKQHLYKYNQKCSSFFPIPIHFKIWHFNNIFLWKWLEELPATGHGSKINFPYPFCKQISREFDINIWRYQTLNTFLVWSLFR